MSDCYLKPKLESIHKNWLSKLHTLNNLAHLYVLLFCNDCYSKVCVKENNNTYHQDGFYNNSNTFISTLK